MDDGLPPIEGAVRQTPVEYVGGMVGSFTIRGEVSRREYRFAQSPDDRWQWLLIEDLERFRLLPDFEVHDTRAIDPERDDRHALNARIEALERVGAPAAKPVGRLGRPPVPDEHAARAWHLDQHCGWRWRAVAEHQGIEGDNPEAAVQQRASRWAKRNPSEAGTSECNLCLSEDCPTSPD